MISKFNNPGILSRRLAFLSLGTTLVIATSTPAKAVVLNFDPGQISGTGLSAMSNSPGSLVPTTARLSNQFLASSGVVFSSTSPYVALIDIETGFPGNAPSPPNGIGGVIGDSLSYSTPILATFFLPSNPALKAITNFVSVQADTIGLGGTITLEAFNTAGGLIGSTFASDSGGPIMSLSVAGIHSVRITGSSTTGFDNFTFNEVSLAPAEVVPEPSTIFGLVFLGVGAAFRVVFAQKQED